MFRKFLLWIANFSPAQLKAVGNYLHMISVACGVILERLCQENTEITWSIIIALATCVVTFWYG
ncbi:MAG: hypothetical protein IK089_00005, partial [Oxalobacter sp.]|nr:hypothetical protein [Oxalobacter sp.]